VFLKERFCNLLKFYFRLTRPLTLPHSVHRVLSEFAIGRRCVSADADGSLNIISSQTSTDAVAELLMNPRSIDQVFVLGSDCHVGVRLAGRHSGLLQPGRTRSH
jgi:hypothetical protein